MTDTITPRRTYADELNSIATEFRRLAAIAPADDLARFGPALESTFRRVNLCVAQPLDVAAGGTGDGTCGLYPTKGMVRFRAALEAFQGEGEFVFVGHEDDDTPVHGAQEAP